MSRPSDVAPLWLAAGLALVKLAILGLIGPSTSPDTPAYVGFADGILDGSALAPLAWGADTIPAVVFRTAGYPLFLAAARLIAPGFWAPLAIILQGALSIAAIVVIFRVARRIFAASGWALLATLLYACSQSLLWDNSLLSDSLYASLFNLVIFTLLGALLGCWHLSSIKIAGLAVLWGYAIWTRDNGLYFTYLPLLLLLGIGCAKPTLKHRLAAPVAFAAIVAAMVGGYVLLNLHRTGEAFFSITGLENFLRPLFDMRAHGYADPFTGDDLIARTVRETMTGYDFPAQVQLIETLHRRCACTPYQLQALVRAKFVAGVAQHPLAYLRVVVGNLRYFDLASAVVDPVATVNEFVQLGTPTAERVIPGLSLRHLAALRQHFSLTMLALMLVAGVTKLISSLAFTLFVVGIPFLWVRQWCRRGSVVPELWAVGFLWFAFVSVSLAFSLIHIEARHALPVFPAALIGIVYMVAWLMARSPVSAKG